MAEGFRQRLREGGINPQDLVITRVLSQQVEDYKVDTPTALAARQLEAAGIHIQPGEKVRYVHREGKRGPKECRVAAAPFLETLDGYDTKLYLELLERAVEEVMLALERACFEAIERDVQRIGAVSLIRWLILPYSKAAWDESESAVA